MSFLSHELKFDLFLAEHFIYKNGFPLKDSFLLEGVFHKMGAKFIGLLNVLFLLLAIFKKDKKQKKFFFYISITSLFSLGLVGGLKTETVIACPWSLKQFGGTHDFVHYWQMFSSSSFMKDHCFPAGHATGGYALMSIFFGYLLFYKKCNFKLLIPALTVGGTFGIVQQLRGAHFLSHDLATIAICLLVNFITSIIFNRFINEKN